MVKTTQKSDLPWSAIFSVIVYWGFVFGDNYSFLVAMMFSHQKLKYNFYSVMSFGDYLHKQRCLVVVISHSKVEVKLLKNNKNFGRAQ